MKIEHSMQARVLFICSLAGVVLSGCAFDTDIEATNEPEEGLLGRAEQELPANKGIILIDRTGSMVATRSTGNSRCRDARQQALDKVTQFFTTFGGSALSVWTFNGSTVTKLTGYVNSATATNAINGLSMNGCSNATPLADAICQAADELYVLRGNDPNKPNLLTILTDGGENTSVGICDGNNNGIGDPGSWQSKARARINNYYPYVQVNPMFWTGSTYVNLKGIDPETGSPLPQISPNVSGCSTGEQCDHQFLLQIAVDTGGTYDLVKDNNTKFPCSAKLCPAPYYTPIAW